MSEQTFSSWHRAPDAFSASSALVQIKWTGGLIDYPTGKSAMIWYGVVSPCSPATISALLRRLEPCIPSPELVWRWYSGEDQRDQLVALNARFEARFGGPLLGASLESKAPQR